MSKDIQPSTIPLTTFAKAQYTIATPITGIGRYNNDEYTYVKAIKSHDDIEKYFSCPTCIAHCIQIDELKTHYYANHLETLAEQSQTTL